MIDRRKFLQWGSFLTVSVASSTLLTACGSDDDNAVSGTGNNGGGDQGGGNGNSGNAVTFAQGVASGDPKADSIILWTRVDGANGKDAASVTVQVSTDQKFTSMLVNTTVQADPSWDYTIRHKVTGLNASTTYYYRFIIGSVTSTVGRTKTAPAANADVAKLKFAFISCQDWTVNHWGAFDELQKEDLDFIVHVGDYIYEMVDIPVTTIPATESAHAEIVLPNGTKRADGSTYATTVADYRSLYKTYRSDARLQALHASFPMIAIWDDHEFSDDCWQDRQTYDATDDATPQTARRRSANQAWFEFMPADVTLDLNNPSFKNIQIYRSFTFGKLATLVMTDERLYRADHVISEKDTGGSTSSRYLVSQDTLAAAEKAKMDAAAGALTPVSMLGDTQRGWWQDQMKNATTTWKLWGNEVSLLRMQVDVTTALANAMTQVVVQLSPAVLEPLESTLFNAFSADLAVLKADKQLPAAFANFNTAAQKIGFNATLITEIIDAVNAMLPPLELLTFILLDADQWDGYNAERKSMMAYLQTNSISNVVALTGDIHAFFAGTVMDDFDAAKPQPVMVDLVTAGISSTSLFKYYVEFLHNTPSLSSLAPLVFQGGVNNLNGTLTSYNAWLKHVDTDAQGYAVVTLTPTELNCTFSKMKPVVDSKAPASPAVASTTQVKVTAGTAAVTVVTPA